MSVKPSNCFGIMNHLARLVLALLFFVSAVTKSADPNEFARQVGDFGLVFDALVTPTAWAIILAEWLIAVSLALSLRHSVIAAAGLLLLFIGVLTYGMALGLDIECGCFGPAIHVSLRTQLLTDLGLLLLCAIIYRGEKRACLPAAPDAPNAPQESGTVESS